MRLIFIIMTIGACVTFGQHSKVTVECDKRVDSLTNREIYNVVDSPASIVGGLSKLYSELGTIEIPKNPETDQINILISFVVEPNGDITNLKTLGKIENTKLDKKLLELFKKYKWTPAICNGKKVPTRLVLVVKS